ncbi:MAG: thiamine pyrophosphate-binding protein [Candidatus Pacearchaeota archaeon]
MRVADYILNRLSNEGIKDVFVLYGGACAGMIDAFTKIDKIRYKVMQHEQAAGFAAEGYAKASNGLGAAIVTSGPGAQNLVTPIANCYYDSTPVIFLTGQVPIDHLKQNKKARQLGFQETPICEIVAPITKYSKMITHPEEIKYELDKAIYLAKSGRPGPVLLDLPQDIQIKEIGFQKTKNFNPKDYKINFNLQEIDLKVEQFLLDIKKSEKPVVIVGGGVRLARSLDELMEFEERFQIPLFPTWNATDVVTSDNLYYGGGIGGYGGKGRNFGIQNSDLILALGTRLSPRILGEENKYFSKGAKKYVVDIDTQTLKTAKIPINVKIHSDVKLFLQRLLLKSKNQTLPDFSKWNEKVQEWRDIYDPASKECFDEHSNKGYTNPYAFVRLLSEQISNMGIVIADTGGSTTILGQAYETKKGQRVFASNGNSPMGFSFPAAIGAWFASDKKQEVVSLIGDGGFNLNIQELQTLKTYDVGIKVFIMNNHCLGFTRAFQKRKFGGKTAACDKQGGYIAPDFIKIAQAYGLRTETITGNNKEKLKSDIRNVLDINGPVICNVDNGDFDNYWWC